MSSIPGLSEFQTLEHKTLHTQPLGLTYSYYLSPDFGTGAKPTTPTLLFVHGFPDHAQMWSGIVPQMLSLPYKFLIVDILGLGQSTKSTNASDYNWKQQATSIAQILDAENVHSNVIPIGHDWGSAISQRFYLYHQNRCSGLVLLSLAYMPPSGQPLDLEKVNETTAERFGYPQFEYWNIMTQPDGAALMDSNLDRMYEVMHGLYPSPIPEEHGRDIWMREMFCVPENMRNYIGRTGKYKDYTVPLKPYAQNPALKQSFLDRMSRQGFRAPVHYYHILVRNTMLEDEQELCQAPHDDGKRIDVPLLYIGQTGDWVCRTDLMGPPKSQGLVPDLEERALESGHWVLYERPDDVASVLSEWLQRKFPVEK